MAIPGMDQHHPQGQGGGVNIIPGVFVLFCRVSCNIWGRFYTRTNERLFFQSRTADFATGNCRGRRNYRPCLRLSAMVPSLGAFPRRALVSFLFSFDATHQATTSTCSGRCLGVSVISCMYPHAHVVSYGLSTGTRFKWLAPGLVTLATWG